jgi:branched-chain amino acid aminotransferase
MAAGTAAALVPIRSITRRSDAAAATGGSATSLSTHARLTVTDGEETVTYIPDEQPDAGPACMRLLGALQGIQLGREADTFGWNVRVEEADLQLAAVAEE